MQSYKSVKGLYSALLGTEQDREKIPSAYYHYTSLSGFIGMMSDYNKVDNGKCTVHMHSSHIRFSNDTKEFKIGEEEVKKYLKCDTCKKDCSLNAEGTQVFVVCFCEGKDLLHQWTCYGSDGGIAID